MAEAGIFELPLEMLNKMTYKDLESNFSKFYKSLSSVGVQIDDRKIESRMYSFGETSGYFFPIKIPFPFSTKADVWDDAVREFNYLEEFVVNSKGEKFFIDCVFSSMSSSNLLGVTRENYLYNFDNISLLKIAKDESYKTWYGESIGFDYDNKPILNLRSFFVYPKSTQNDYFNKYDIAERYPSNMVVGFDILKFFLQDLTQDLNYDESGYLRGVRYSIQGKNGKSEDMVAPKELSPVKSEGVNELFPLTEYYNAINNRFPDFAKSLSIMGTLKYDKFKKLLNDKQVGVIDDKSDNLLSAIYDYRSLARYSRDKENFERQGMKFSSPEKDELLLQVQDIDSVIKKIEKEKNIEIFKKYGKIGLVVLLIIVIFWVFLRKNKIKISIDYEK